jgi:hypothetical protein
MLNIFDAIYQLYPQVLSISGDVAYEKDGNVVPYDLQAVTTQAQKNACKTQAKYLLSASDWSVLPDVGLTNQADFITYRGILRGYALQPVVDPIWPTEPTPIWQ